MKKTVCIILCMIACQVAISQTYFTRTGFTEFKASVEAFEPVEAKNNSTTAILKTQTGDIAAQLFITAFKFRVALMQEHFNENYMDSDKFPKAVFRGKLDNFDMSSLSGEKEYNLNGSLTIKGVKKEINTKALLKKDGEKIVLSATFSVKPQDFDIKIPSIVRKKIADKINITLNYELVEKK
ncbi:YceI family protein [Pseudotenacibaculum haliotis]|uniref:YceI family protein n=1 Tax=Pseudotenacibaculum haliotis TaxID=1862138 RepID=A0ABW5LSS5_9FLAO